MKTDHQPKPAVFPQTIASAIVALKNRLQHNYEQVYPNLGEIIHIVLEEEETSAWNLSPFPHLLLPDLVEAHIARLGLEPANSRQDNVPSSPIDSRRAVAAAC